MADSQDITNTPTAAGQQPAPVIDGQQATQPSATFTQADIDRIVKERLDRERAKYSDYDKLKQAQAELDKIKAAQMSEDEKRAAKLKELEDLAAVRTQERDTALALANERLVKAAFVAEAAKAGAEHPEDAFLLANRAAVQVGEAGEVAGVSEAVQALVKAGRLPLRKTQATAPALDGGAAGSKQEAGVPKLSEEQERIAREMGIKPEVYAKRLAETQKQRR